MSYFVSCLTINIANSNNYDTLSLFCFYNNGEL